MGSGKNQMEFLLRCQLIWGTGSRKVRIRDFRRRLAVWAKETWGAWKRAASELDCDEKTLREDAGMWLGC